MKKDLLSKNSVFPLLVLLFSAGNFLNLLTSVSIPSLVVSAIGIVSVVMYYLNNKSYKWLFQVWIWTQILVISHTAIRGNTYYVEDYLNMTQVFKITFGFSSKSSTSETGIYLNVLPFIYIALYRLLRTSGAVGKKFTFTNFSAEGRLADVLPAEGTVQRLITLDGEKDWLLVQLEKPMDFEGETINYIITKRKDGEALEPGDKQIVYFKLVRDLADLMPANPDETKFPFIDWAYCS